MHRTNAPASATHKDAAQGYCRMVPHKKLSNYHGILKVKITKVLIQNTSGFVFTLNGGPISYASEKQAVVALSSTKTEYVASSPGCFRNYMASTT